MMRKSRRRVFVYARSSTRHISHPPDRLLSNHYITSVRDSVLRVFHVDVPRGWSTLPTQPSYLPWELSLTEIALTLISGIYSNLNSPKSPDLDGAHTIFLSIIALIIAQHQATLFSNSLSSGYVPDDWHLNVVTPFLEKDSWMRPQTTCLSACPLSQARFSSTLSKILSRGISVDITDRMSLSIVSWLGTVV